MENLIWPIGLWIGGMVVGSLSKSIIPKWWLSLSAKFRSDLKDKAKVYLKDPEWRAIVSQIVCKVQKEAGTEANEEKLRKAVNYIVAWSPIPDSLERPILEAMVELIIEEVKNDIDLG